MIPVSDTVIVGNELAYLKECVDSRWVSSLGSFVGRFERAIAGFTGAKFASSVANGTAALHLSLLAAGVSKGSEVIVPASSFVSTANAVAFCNAKPVFVDVDPKTWNIDVSKIEEAITENTKAIIPVDLYGCPAEYDEISKIAHDHNLFVLEDSAEALGATYKGKKCGSLGNAGVFSFYGNKIITSGEGGMVVSDDAGFIERVNLLKDQGKSREKKFFHEVLGYNYRFTNLQAAFGLAQFEGLEMLLKRKREIAGHYRELLSGVDGVSFQFVPSHSRSSYWFVSVVLEEPFPSAEKVGAILKERGIDSRPFFSPLPDLPFYNARGSFPVSRELAQRGLSLPSGASLKDEEIELVCSELKRIALR